MQIKIALNGYLDKSGRSNIRIGQHTWDAFKFCGLTGLALAVALAVYLASRLELSIWIMAGIIVSALLTFLGFSFITKIITGEEQLIYYHHEIAVLTVGAVLLWLLNQPILQYLDVTILGVGMFLACGRVGCFMVGCCHGKPASWGVSYPANNLETGFNPHFVGVRLFPIQVLESLWAFGIVIVGTILVLTGRPPGEALAWYVVTYGLGRFFFEFMRGDHERHYYLGFSEAQWTSLLLMVAVVWAGRDGIMNLQLWHQLATAFVGLTMVVVAVRKVMVQGTSGYFILDAPHLREIAEATQLASNLAVKELDFSLQGNVPVNINVGCTSLGIQISSSRINYVEGSTYHYTISSQKGMLREMVARAIAKFILRIKHPNDPHEFSKGNSNSVFHLLIHISKDQESEGPMAVDASTKVYVERYL